MSHPVTFSIDTQNKPTITNDYRFNSSLNGKPLKPFALSKKNRLLKRKDFLRVQKIGRRAFGKHFVVIMRVLPPHKEGQFGITVPKKVGKAHDRNKIKRRIRHVFRTNPNLYQQRLIVIVAKGSLLGTPFCELQKDLTQTTGRLTKPRNKDAA